jgi:pimeloyl-ACP methyl ester carboxylesterase
MSFIETDDGVRLRLHDSGEGSPPVVLVHGWKGSHRLFDRAIARLSERQRVVAFDLRGMGESDKPRCNYDFDELSGDLRFVLRALDLEDVTLVGWSMGCTVSLRYMERGGERVGRLVLMNGPLRLTKAPDFPHAMTEEELDGYLTRLSARWPDGEREFQAATVVDPSPALVDWLQSIAVQTPLDVALRAVRNQARLDMRDALAGVPVPVLAAYSVHDPYYPTSLAHDIAERAPDGRAVIFERSGHCIAHEETERFCAVVEAFGAGDELP